MKNRPFPWGTLLCGVIGGLALGQLPAVRAWYDRPGPLTGLDLENPLVFGVAVLISGFFVWFILNPLIDWLDSLPG